MMQNPELRNGAWSTTPPGLTQPSGISLRQSSPDFHHWLASDERKGNGVFLTFRGPNNGASTETEFFSRSVVRTMGQVHLDIHIPPRMGLDIVPELIESDFDAFVIMLSSDSHKENVLLALERGAIGFLGKPPKKEKVLNYLNQCATFRMPKK